MAHYKRKRKHWQRLCMCKYYKRAAGNGKERRPPRGVKIAGASVMGLNCESMGAGDAPMIWTRPEFTAHEQAMLADGTAIVYGHDGIMEVVRCDALPHDLDVYCRAQERAELLKIAKEALRKSAPRGVKITRKLARAKGLL